MGVWGWIVLYVLVFSLLQLLIYRYLRRDEDASLFQSTPPNNDATSLEESAFEEGAIDEAALEEVRDRNRHADGDDPGAVSCPRCGTANEPGYTYCRNCVKPMGAPQ